LPDDLESYCHQIKRIDARNSLSCAARRSASAPSGTLYSDSVRRTGEGPNHAVESGALCLGAASVSKVSTPVRFSEEATALLTGTEGVRAPGAGSPGTGPIFQRNGMNVPLENACQDSSTSLVIAFVQTLGRLGTTRLAECDAHDFKAVVVDECRRLGTSAPSDHAALPASWCRGQQSRHTSSCRYNSQYRSAR
jgi:hypothetical protein